MSGRATSPTANSDRTRISADGRFAAFESDQPGLVPGDLNGLTEVFVYSWIADTLVRVSVDSNGAEVSGAEASFAVLSADGSQVLLEIDPSTLAIPGRYNAVTGEDVYLANNPLVERLLRDGFE